MSVKDRSSCPVFFYGSRKSYKTCPRETCPRKSGERGGDRQGIFLNVNKKSSKRCMQDKKVAG